MSVSPLPIGNTLRWFSLVASLYLLLLAVAMISTGFKLASGEQAMALFEFASHPITGLMVGLTATALIQSSSTTTSIIVGLVAGGLPLQIAIPMIMGANIGTTLTNTLVSLGHLRCQHEFRRAFAGATVHDFFNLLAVSIFLPLEIMFGLLEKLSSWIVAPFATMSSSGSIGFDFIKPMTKPVTQFITTQLQFENPIINGAIVIGLGIFILFFAVLFMGQQLKTLMVGRAETILKTALGRGPCHGIAAGTAVTVLVQSSSTTTSLIVPLIGNNIITLKEAYPFTLGANIGTCITALLAAMAVSGEHAILGLQIALVHLCFNVLGVLVLYGIPLFRNVPIHCAEWLAEKAQQNKLTVVAYIATVFFIIPAALITMTH
ncbi:Na/Pi symporter [Shewanella sp. OMA3-2]|uniref:Na/Pi symporter n=1 Tax=Shewanella sp. OMA3-2 TaxID=2908650 RepID=UPI001F27D375|nr:Na/Pi symporter [Shewanella sp. OMA3-2]UJF22809.1 Na/Pi symporter [Shewanella sp. OMA3-2]